MLTGLPVTTPDPEYPQSMETVTIIHSLVIASVPTGVDKAKSDAATLFHSPLNYPALVPKDRRLIIAGLESSVAESHQKALAGAGSQALVAHAYVRYLGDLYGGQLLKRRVASQFVKVIQALRRNTPSTTIEILTPDFRNKSEAAVEEIVAAGPDVYNHNLETVPSLYVTVRPGALHVIVPGP